MDIMILASTYNEPLDDIVSFISFHCSIINNLPMRAALVVVFETKERSKADTVAKLCKQIKSRLDIIILVNNKGAGFSSCLNYAIEAIDCNFIVRVDTDDRCVPGRIEEQVRAMEAQYLDLSYGWMMTKNGKILRYPCSNLGIWFSIALGMNPIPHPTVCIRSKTIKSLGLYATHLSRAEDFDLWIRGLRSKKVKIGCIKEPLTIYNTERAECKNKENAIAQIRIRASQARLSFDTFPLVIGMFFNLIRLATSTSLLMKARRSS